MLVLQQARGAHGPARSPRSVAPFSNQTFGFSIFKFVSFFFPNQYNLV
jgi:hypothetical protein